MQPTVTMIRRLVVLGLVGVTGLAGCGSDNKPSASHTSSPMPSSTSVSTTGALVPVSFASSATHLFIELPGVTDGSGTVQVGGLVDFVDYNDPHYSPTADAFSFDSSVLEPTSVTINCPTDATCTEFKALRIGTTTISASGPSGVPIVSCPECVPRAASGITFIVTVTD